MAQPILFEQVVQIVKDRVNFIKCLNNFSAYDNLTAIQCTFGLQGIFIERKSLCFFKAFAL